MKRSNVLLVAAFLLSVTGCYTQLALDPGPPEDSFQDTDQTIIVIYDPAPEPCPFPAPSPYPEPPPPPIESTYQPAPPPPNPAPTRDSGHHRRDGNESPSSSDRSKPSRSRNR